MDGIAPSGADCGIAMIGNYVLLPDDDGGILVEDMAWPAAIKQIGRISMPGKPERVWGQGDKAYVADESGALVIVGVSTATAAPPSAASSPNSSSDDKIAYITIDDGPSRNITPKNLDTLKAYGVKATFFVLLHENLDDIYQRIIDEGHAIGNHSYGHDPNLLNNADKFRSDVVKARDYIYNKFDYTTTVYRFPGGTMGHNKDKIKASADILKELGYSYFDWDVSTADTDPNLKIYGDEKFIVNLLTNNILKHTNGKKKLVILMHDSSGKGYTSKALPGIIEGLKKQGYKFDVLTNY